MEKSPFGLGESDIQVSFRDNTVRVKLHNDRDTYQYLIPIKREKNQCKNISVIVDCLCNLTCSSVLCTPANLPMAFVLSLLFQINIFSYETS